MIPISKELEAWISKQSACWKGYEQVGTKMLDGREVPNCVPASKDIPNSKPKKKKTEKKAEDEHDSSDWMAPGDSRLLNIGKGLLLGSAAGGLLTQGYYSISDLINGKPSKNQIGYFGIPEHNSIYTDRSGSVLVNAGLGALLGGAAYGLAPTSDKRDKKDKKDKSKKKAEDKTLNKAAGLLNKKQYDKAYEKLLKKYEQDLAKDLKSLQQKQMQEMIDYVSKNPLPSTTSSVLMSLLGLAGGGALGAAAGNFIEDGKIDISDNTGSLVGAAAGGLLGSIIPNAYYKIKDKYNDWIFKDKYDQLYKDLTNQHGQRYVDDWNELLGKTKDYRDQFVNWMPAAMAAGALTKKSEEGGMNVSDYIADVPIKCTPGVGCKRLLSDAEKAEIADAENNIISNLFPQDADPISSLISSPGWSGLGSGLLGAAGLGGTVGLGAHLTNKDPLVYGGLAAALGGLGGGLYGYLSKTRKNKEIADLIEDLPVGADIGDIEIYSDPKVRAALSRDFQRQLMRKNLV